MLFDLVVNTRPAHKNLELQALLTDFEVLSRPALSLQPLDFELPAGSFATTMIDTLVASSVLTTEL